jgi:hypothetical protein
MISVMSLVLEAGFDPFSFIPRMMARNQKLMQPVKVGAASAEFLASEANGLDQAE